MNRKERLWQWLTNTLPGEAFRLETLAGDASFRHYSRVIRESGETLILMDAPPPQEDVRPFLQRAAELRQAGVRTPQVLAQHEQQGFLLLEDFGDMTWAQALQEGYELTPLLHDALRQSHAMQAIPASVYQRWPAFDSERIRRECSLWTDWFLPYIARQALTATVRQQMLQNLTTVFLPLTTLPQVAVHLDFHSRNLMLPSSGLPLGVIDFQDAVAGPVTYDLASLLYDCYQQYPEPLRHQWSLRFFHQLPRALQAAFDDATHWHRILQLTALQRHFKAIGIFARLAHRDGKQQFLAEIPLTCQHMQQELNVFSGIMPPALRELVLNSTESFLEHFGNSLTISS